MSKHKNNTLPNMLYRMKTIQKVPKWMKKRGKRRIDVLMSLPEHKLRHLLSLQENSFEQRELFEIATVHLDFNNQRRLQERRKLTDETVHKIQLQSSCLSDSKYSLKATRSTPSGKPKAKRKLSRWRSFKKRKYSRETEKMMEALDSLKNRVQEYDLNLRDQVKNWKQIWKTIKTEGVHSQALWEKTAETLIRWGRQPFLDILEKRETTRRMWREQVEVMSRAAGEILTERLFAVRPVLKTLDIQQKALSAKTSPETPARVNKSGTRKSVALDKYLTTELSDDDQLDTYRPPVPARRGSVEAKKKRKRQLNSAGRSDGRKAETNAADDKDTGATDNRSIQPSDGRSSGAEGGSTVGVDGGNGLQSVASSGLSGSTAGTDAAVLFGDSVCELPRPDAGPVAVGKGSALAPASSAAASAAAAASAVNDSVEAESEEVGDSGVAPKAQMCVCDRSSDGVADSQPRDADPSSDANTTDADRQSSRNIPVGSSSQPTNASLEAGAGEGGNKVLLDSCPVDLWKRMKDAGLIKDREWMFKRFKDCFVGREATQFLVSEGICSTRSMAVKLMRALVEEKMIQHVMFKRLGFKDGFFFYHWLVHRVEVKGEVVSVRSGSFSGPEDTGMSARNSFAEALSDPIAWSSPPPLTSVSSDTKRHTAQKMLQSGIITNLDFTRLSQEAAEDLVSSSGSGRGRDDESAKPICPDKYKTVVCVENLQSIRRACALLNAAAKRRAKAPASEGAAEKADRPLDSIDTAVVFSKRVSKYYTCKKINGAWKMSTTFNPANDVVLLRRVELTAKGMAYLPGGGVQPEEAEKKDLPVGDAFFVTSEQLLARDVQYDAARHFTEDLERRLQAIDSEVAEFCSDLSMFVNRKERLLALLSRYRIMRHRSARCSRRDLEDVCRDDPDGTNTAARQHASSFFEVEELLPEELEYAGNSPWSSWRTTLAKQLRGEALTDQMQRMISNTACERELKLLVEQFGGLMFDDRTPQGSLFRRWLDTLADVTMAVVPAFIKFFTKVLNFDFDLRLPDTTAAEMSSTTPVKDGEVRGSNDTQDFESPQRGLRTPPDSPLKGWENSPALEAGSRVSMGMWLGKRVSTSDESSMVLRAARKWVSQRNDSDAGDQLATLETLPEHEDEVPEEDMFADAYMDTEPVTPPHTPKREPEAPADKSDTMATETDVEKRLSVKGVVDLLEMLTASAIYAHPLVSGLCFRSADVAEGAAERDSRWRKQLPWVRTLAPKAFDIAESFLQLSHASPSSDAGSAALPPGLTPGCRLAALLPKLQRQLKPFETSHMPTAKVKALLKTTALIAMEAAQLDKEAKQQQQVVGDGAGSGADVILPILVYAAVHSGMKHPYRCVAIAQTLGTDADKGEAAYYLCSLEVALTYVTNLQQYPLMDHRDSDSSPTSARSSTPMESPDAATPTTSAADETRLQHNSERNETPQFSLTQEELSGSVKRALSEHERRSVRTTKLQKGWLQNLQSADPHTYKGVKSAQQEFQRRQSDVTESPSAPLEITTANEPPSSPSVFENVPGDLSPRDLFQEDFRDDGAYNEHGESMDYLEPPVGDTTTAPHAAPSAEAAAGVLGALKAQLQSADARQNIEDDELDSWFDERFEDDD